MYVDEKMGNTQEEEEEDNHDSDDATDEEESDKEEGAEENHSPFFPNVMYRYEACFIYRDMIPTFGMSQQVSAMIVYDIGTRNRRGESGERNLRVYRNYKR